MTLRLATWLRLVLVLIIVRLGYYNRRDLFSHSIRKEEPARRPCLHACCRGMRPHPEGYPVVKRNAYLRYSSDKELQGYYNRHQADTEADERVRSQVLAEMQRRDVADERREAAEERRRRRWTARRMERAEAIEQGWRAAEEATKGNRLNRRGRESSIDERTLFRGPESRARKYASEELLNWWEWNPRPTEAYFQGEETRIGRVGVRKRITSEEQYWRDQYERAEYAIKPSTAA
jgi:hypothetical protein